MRELINVPLSDSFISQNKGSAALKTRGYSNNQRKSPANEWRSSAEKSIEVKKVIDRSPVKQTFDSVVNKPNHSASPANSENDEDHVPFQKSIEVTNLEEQKTDNYRPTELQMFC